MADINEILGKKIDSVKALRAEIKRLQDSLVGVDADSEQFKATSQQLAAAQDELRKITRASTDENLAAKDSIVGMQQEYKKLYDQYKLLSDEQRNSDFGKNMAESLNTLSEKLNDTKKGVGNFKDNIGRYAGDITQVFQSMGLSVGALQKPLALASGGVKTLGAALKSLIANPVGAVIMAIVVAFKAMEAVVKRVKEAINNNEESQMRLKEAMASFQPIIDAVSNAFDKLGQIVVNVIGFIGKAVDGIRTAGAAVTDFLGITKGAKKGVQDQIKTYKDLAKAQNDLTLKTREYKKINAADKAEVEKLREEASETTDLIEKKQLLEDAKAKQAEIDQRNIEIAQEELRILQVESGLTANNAETNEKLAAAIEKVSNAKAQAAANARLYNKQLNTVSKTTTTTTKKTDEYRKKAKELYKSLVEDSKLEVQKLTDKYTEEKKLLEKYHLDTTLLTKKYNKDIQVIRDAAYVKATTSTSNYFNKVHQLYIESLKNTKITQAREIENLDALDEMRLARFNKEYKKLNLADSITFDPKDNDAFEKTQEFLNNFKLLLTQFNNEFAGIQLEMPETFFELPQLLKDKLITPETYKSLSDSFINLFENSLDYSDDIIKQRIQEDFGNIIITGIENALKKIDKASLDLNLQSLLDGVDSKKFTEAYNQNLYDSLFAEKKVLEESIVNFKGTQDQKTALMQQYYDVVSQMRENEWALQELDVERTQAVWDAAFESFDKVTSSINNVIGAYSSLVEAEVNSGKISKQEAEKKIKVLKRLEKIQLAVNIANIAASTAAGIMDVWKSYGAELALNAQTAAAAGPGAAPAKAALDAKSLAAAILRTTSLGATAAANIAAASMGTIAKIRSYNEQLEGLGSSSIGATVTPQLIDSTPYTYTRTLQTAEEIDEMNKPIWVSVEDIASALDKRTKVREESSF